MEHHDDKLREMMKMAKVEMPFADFEERLMSRIEKVEREKAAVAKTRKYALLCFVLGTLFGMGFNYLLADFVKTSVSASEAVKSNLLLFSQLVYVLLIVLFSDKIWRLMKLRKFTK